MTDTSRAIRFHEFGGTEVLRLERVPVPKPAEGEVCVRTVAAAVNPKDCLVRKGKFEKMTGTDFPFGVGHDFAGVIDAVGPGVTDLQPGDRVFGMTNGMVGRTYADHVALPRAECAEVPEAVDLVHAAGVPLAALTALQALRDLAGVRVGRRVLINGASGGVGVYAVQIARILGGEVTAVCSAANEALVRDLGAVHWIDYTRNPVDSLTDQFDVIFDVFGNYHFKRLKSQLKSGGVYVTTVPNRRNLADHVLSGRLGGKKGRLVIVKSKQADLELLASWLKDGRLKPVVDRTFDLTQAAGAHAYIETKRARGKIILLTGQDLGNDNKPEGDQG